MGRGRGPKTQIFTLLSKLGTNNYIQLLISIYMWIKLCDSCIRPHQFCKGPHKPGSMCALGPSINYVTPKGGGWPSVTIGFLLFKSIRILTESVTWEEGGQKLPILALHNLWMAPPISVLTATLVNLLRRLSCFSLVLSHDAKFSNFVNWTFLRLRSFILLCCIHKMLTQRSGPL